MSKGFRVNLFDKVVIIRDYGKQMYNGKHLTHKVYKRNYDK